MLSIVKGPYLQWPTRDSMTIMWETSVDASAEVTCWETRRVHADGAGRFHKIEDSACVATEGGNAERIHRVVIQGLQPETSYLYKVRSVDDQGNLAESNEIPFMTAVEETTPFSFAVTSEMGGSGSDDFNREIFVQMGRYRPDFLLIAGDAVSSGRNYADWERFLFGPARDLLQHTPFYLCLGNHEENSPWFYRFVAYPEPKNYYAFHYGSAHFIALDSTAIVEYQKQDKQYAPVLSDHFGPGNLQYDFLLNELSDSQAVWKIVFFHYPPFVSADYQVDEMRLLCPLLEEHGVDMVFNSHTIVYERSHPLRAGKVDYEHDVVYVVAGGAGQMPQWFHHKRAWHTAQSLTVPHFVQVVIAGRRLELRAIDFEGRLFDLLTLTK